MHNEGGGGSGSGSGSGSEGYTHDGLETVSLLVSLHNLMLALGVPLSSHSILRWPLALCGQDTYIYLQFSIDCAMCSMRI